MEYFQCDICEKVYKLTTNLFIHYKNVHQIQGEFKCMFCDKQFSNRSSLIRHLENIHEQNKEPKFMKCKICDIKISNGYGKLVHHVSRIHDRKNYQCKKCKDIFLSNLDLSQHRNQHKKDQTECHICKKKIVKVKEHMKLVHSELGRQRNSRCDVCGKSYISTQLLQFHMSKHKNEKPYQCSVCDFKSVYPNDVKIHTNLIHKQNKKNQL